MKILSTILICLLSMATNAQTIHFKIEGTVTDTTDVKFAYLSTLAKQISVSSDKLFLKVPIVDGKFAFDSHFDLEGKSMQQAFMFLDKRDNITQEEVALKLENIVWIIGFQPNFLRVILEDTRLQVENKQQLSTAVITGGGVYTNHLREWAAAIRKGRKALVEFIWTHTTSPVSLIAIHDMLPPEPGETVPQNETSLALFNSLSPQIKASKDGQEIKKGLMH